MLFEALIVGALVFMAIATPGLVVLSFIKGYSTGVKDYNKSHPGEEKIEPARKPKAVPEYSEDQQRLKTLLENIDNYDGTSAHQQELN